MSLDTRYQGTQITTPPDFSGPFGKAWRIALAPIGQRSKPDFDATLDLFLVQRSGAHVCWDHWLVSIVHLRPMAGVRPARINLEGATHELMIVALDPEQPLPGLDSTAPGWRSAWLTPIDVMEQFACPDDAMAHHFLELSIQAIVNGFLSPDQDDRARWKASIAETSRHFTNGTHTMPRPM